MNKNREKSRNPIPEGMVDGGAGMLICPDDYMLKFLLDVEDGYFSFGSNLPMMGMTFNFNEENNWFAGRETYLRAIQLRYLEPVSDRKNPSYRVSPAGLEFIKSAQEGKTKKVWRSVSSLTTNALVVTLIGAIITAIATLLL